MKWIEAFLRMEDEQEMHNAKDDLIYRIHQGQLQFQATNLAWIPSVCTTNSLLHDKWFPVDHLTHDPAMIAAAVEEILKALWIKPGTLIPTHSCLGHLSKAAKILRIKLEGQDDL